ncbi:hypothetical protein HanXRQr2_Chr12g0533081 [Helianthus annuus]|uniref:Uncharacterized protein n=1 Tax=Helianthus annuus TaxID=4232 RepID=A0A9K3MVA9_HELAN|nr:hypothetical protein HanXRQr2_Chr12g0533081 [Helianthus annuus]KAJ0492383.1 hypothetical protein HanIR_Chr12g0574261 [Helianthus annuus]KAJ0862032.1 hypothetical protein HanPSC8_Chr12g0513441 [Helianthus annuus]
MGKEDWTKCGCDERLGKKMGMTRCNLVYLGSLEVKRPIFP